MKTSLPPFCLALLAGFVLFASALAQTAAGRTATVNAQAFASQISGTVEVDGLAVPGVTITITDPTNGQSFVTSTDERGRFVARVSHTGEFDIAANMIAFAPALAKVTVLAGGQATPVAMNLTLASPAAMAVAAANRPAKPAGAKPSTASPLQAAAGAAAMRGGRQTASTAEAGNRGGGRIGGGRFGGGRGGAGSARGGSNESNVNGFQQLDVNQTGDISAADANAGANSSGIAGMSDSAATDSAVVTGQASQDNRPMDAGAIQGFMRAQGITSDFGGARGGGPGGFAGGGRGGFRGRGGFGGRGGFMFARFNNRFNQPHGNLSYSLSDSALNALPDSITGATNTQNPPNAANQRYSATLTTPFKIPHIYDDHGHTSLTVSFFGVHDSNLASVSALVPTVLERAGNFQGLTDNQGKPVTIKNPATGQPYSQNTITNISPAAQALLAYIPLPTPGASGRFNYTNTLNSLNTSHNFSLRLNHSFGSAPGGGGRGFGGFGGRGRSLNFNLNYSGGNSQNPGTFYPYVEGFNKSRGLNAGLGFTQPVAGWTNLLRLNYNRNRTDLTNLYAGITNVAGAAGITGVSSNPIDWGLPALSFTTSGLTGVSDTNPRYLRSSTFSISDFMIRRMGRHNIRFGGDYRWLENNPESDSSPNGAFTFDGQYSGYDFADFLLGLPQQTSERYGGGVFYFRQTEPDLFFNDNWQARSNLTLTYGLRWEYISPYSEIYSRLTNLLVGPGFSTLTPSVAGQNGVPPTVIKPEYGHLRPDLGFAWKTWGNMILRGGFGMAYNSGAYANMATELAYQSPFITTQTNLGTASQPLSLTNGFGSANGVVNTYGVNPDYQVGYSYLWNLDLQRQIGTVWLINIDYSGARGVHLDQLLAPNRTPTGLLYPNLQPFLYDTTGGNSVYNGGSLIVSRRLSQSVSFRASYTYSKMMDDASQIGGGGGAGGTIAQNPQDLAAEWALSAQNVTHRFNAGYEWQLPYGMNHRWGDSSSFLSSALGNWQMSGSFSANSGSPLTPLVNNIYANAQGLQSLGVSAPLRANMVGGQAIALTNPTLTSFFNTAAFAAPAAGSYGDAGRNIIIGPGQVDLDFSLDKNFRIDEFRSLDIRFDATNALNHPNWGGVDTNFNSATFGSITGFRSPRQITFTSRFRF